MIALIISSFLAGAVAPSSVQSFASEDQMAKLDADLRNLEADLSAADPDALPSDARARVDQIRDEVIYLKVKMRKHAEANGEGTGVTTDEVRDLRLDVSDLRNDLRPHLSPATAERGVVLRRGTELNLRLEDGLRSSTAEPGDAFRASVMEPVLDGNRVALEAGSLFHGRVELVDRAEGRTDRSAKLVLALDRLESAGETYDVSATIVDASERLSTGIGAEATKIGIGAGLGSVLGAVLGGKKGAAIGAAVGGGGSILATEGRQVDLPPGTVLQVRLDRDLTLPAK